MTPNDSSTMNPPPPPRRSNPSHLSDHAEMNCGGALSGLRTQIASFQVYMIGVIKRCKGWIAIASSSPLLSKAGGGRQAFYGQHGQFPVTWQTRVCRHVRHMRWIIMWCRKTWRNEGLREEENFRRKPLIATPEHLRQIKDIQTDILFTIILHSPSCNLVASFITPLLPKS